MVMMMMMMMQGPGILTALHGPPTNYKAAWTLEKSRSKDVEEDAQTLLKQLYELGIVWTVYKV